MRKNVAYFKVNYGIVGLGTTALVMFLNPWSLIVLAFLALVWAYAYIVRTSPFVIGGRELRCVLWRAASWCVGLQGADQVRAGRDVPVFPGMAAQLLIQLPVSLAVHKAIDVVRC
jgi:hypothetical protein